MRKSGGRSSLQQAGLGMNSLALSAYLTRRVDYFGREVLPTIFDDFAESILNGRIIALDKMAIHKLNCEGGFSYIGADLSSIQSPSYEIKSTARHLTNRTTANNGHFSLFWKRRHCYYMQKVFSV